MGQFAAAWRLVARGVGVLVVVALTLWWAFFGQPARADNPEVCGYGRVSVSSGPTTTVSGMTFCHRPCGGPFVHQEPQQVEDVEYEVLVCVRNL